MRSIAARFAVPVAALTFNTTSCIEDASEEIAKGALYSIAKSGPPS